MQLCNRGRLSWLNTPGGLLACERRRQLALPAVQLRDARRACGAGASCPALAFSAVTAAAAAACDAGSTSWLTIRQSH